MQSRVLGIIAPHPPIMVPEVGHADSDVTGASIRAMRSAADLLAAFDPDTIVLMSPHAPVAPGAFVIDASASLSGDLGRFDAPDVSVQATGDPELAEGIMRSAGSSGIPIVARTPSPVFEGGLLDHGAIVPLYFLDRASRYPLVVLSLSYLPLAVHRALGTAVRDAAAALGRRVAFVASGDCSHRLEHGAPAGYNPRGAEFDAWLVDRIGAGDLDGLMDVDLALADEAGECGLRSFITLSGFLDGSDARSRLLSYEGPWGVGYLTAVATASGSSADSERTRIDGDSTSGESAPVALARRTIETFLRERRILPTPQADGLLAERHGAFVSLHRNGMLRGCIGTIGPTAPSLAEEIVRNAIQAATADPRFPAMTESELEGLEISVDVPHEAEPTTLGDLDPRTYGVIVSADWRRGLLLPDLDGVDTVELQVSIARQKAGIGPSERVHLERFRVDRYH